MTRSENERIPKPEARVSCAKGCRSPRDLRGDRLDHHGNVAERLIELGEIIGPRSHRCDQDLGIGACWKDLLVGTGSSQRHKCALMMAIPLVEKRDDHARVED